MRNPLKSSQRRTEANERRTELRIEQYYGKVALLATWEDQPSNVQVRNHAYLLELRRQIRNVRNYITHRADPNADLQ